MTTNINVTEQTTTVTTVDDVTTITLANAGVQGIPGVGYTGVTSTSTITIGSGLKTFTLVAGYAGAFITGMRIRAIHSDTPTYYLEGTANYVGAGTLILTVDKFNGSGSHNSWAFAVAGEIGSAGSTGASGVIAVTSPITNTGSASSAIVGIDQTLLSITRSQVSDFTSGTVASAGTAQQAGTAVYATNSGTAVYATTSGTAVFATNSGTAVNISGTITKSQVSDFTSGTVTSASTAQQSGTAVFATTSGTATYATNSGTAIFATNASTAVTISGSITQSQVTNLVTDLAGKASLGSANAFTVGGHTITAESATVKPLIIKAAASQSVNLLEFQSSGSTTPINRVSSDGTLFANTFTLNALGQIGENTNGGSLRLTRATGAQTNPGANIGRLYFRDGTTAGTLKLVTRTGASGVEETLFDNLDTSGTSSIAIGSGVRATDATVATAANGVGYMGLPQNSTTTGSYTIVAADAGEHVYASATRTVTIPANASVAFPVGTTLTFIAGAGATMTIAITTDTMYLAGAGTTGSRTLAAHGIATAVKTTSTTWLISGNGLT
jgi:hypothetical protein